MNTMTNTHHLAIEQAKPHNKTLQFIGIALFSILLTLSCTQKSKLEQAESQTLPNKENRTLEHAIALEARAKMPDYLLRNQLLLQAAYIYMSNRQVHKAKELIQSINPDAFDKNQLAIFNLLNAKLFQYRGEIDSALEIINQNINSDILALDIQFIISNDKANMLLQKGAYLESVKERIYISPLLNKDDKNINNTAIWKTLSLLTKEEIDKHLADNKDQNLQDWLELAYINKAYQHDIEKQNHALQLWMDKTDNNELKKNLPQTIQSIKEALKNRPQKIAILLPEAGLYAKSADAIRRGFLSQHYRSLQENTFNPELLFFNTEPENLKNRYKKEETLSNSLATLLEEKITNEKKDPEQTHTENLEPKPALSVTLSEKEQIERGFLLTYKDTEKHKPDLIIGPINKEFIELLNTEEQIKTPTLALNYTDTQENKHKQLYQFGLAPEDEIDFIINQAKIRNYKNAAILAPDNAWGERLASSFKARWQSAGGKVVSTVNYENTKNISKVVENMLNIDLSEKRFRKLYWYSEGEALFHSRRRKDIDFIYLVSSPEHARQIIPIFSFHDASDIPVFSTSNVYSGHYSVNDKDLNQLFFSEIPAMVNPGQAMGNTWHNQDYRYKRLIAMGVDSYDLSIRLNILKTSENNSLFGKTGTLSMDNNQRIKREPVLVQFQNGHIKLQAGSF